MTKNTRIIKAIARNSIPPTTKAVGFLERCNYEYNIETFHRNRVYTESNR